MLHSLLTFGRTSYEANFTSVDDYGYLCKKEAALIKLYKKEEAKLHDEKTSDLYSALEKTENQELKLARIIEPQQRNPNINGLSPYKIHITLSKESYTDERKEQIENILLKYLHVVPAFKYVDTSRVALELKNINIFLECLKKLKLKNDEEFSREDRANFAEIATYFNESNPWPRYITPDKSDITARIVLCEKQIEEIEKSQVRFLNADQFTIYIPKNINKHALLRMCQEINTLLTNQHAKPGTTAATELKIGDYINFRQEHLLKDYQILTKAPETYEDTRIPSDEAPGARLNALKAEMQQCDIYQYLSKNLNRLEPPNKWQTVWDTASGTSYDKTCMLLSMYAASQKSQGRNKSSLWGGSMWYFFSGKNIHHGDAVQKCLDICSKLPANEQTIERVLTELSHQLGDDPLKNMNPHGALRSILATIQNNTANEPSQKPTPQTVELKS